MKNKSKELNAIIKIFKRFDNTIGNSDLNKDYKTKFQIDSLNEVEIKAEIEESFSCAIPLKNWIELETINDINEYCNKNRFTLKKINNKKTIELSRSFTIGMPQMSLNALSENWLLKEIGDIHWALIEKGLKCNITDIRDEDNSRLYPAFCRIIIDTCSLKDFKEKDSLTFKGFIRRYGEHIYVSKIESFINKTSVGKFELMTTFIKRTNNNNIDLIKNFPANTLNQIESLNKKPEILKNYRIVKLKLNDKHLFKNILFKLDNNIIDTNLYNINPYIDINGVNLLYFASYSILSDYASAEYIDTLLKEDSLYNFKKNYFTVSRDIHYYANCDYDNTINVQINSINLDKSNSTIHIDTSLIRNKDNCLMARIFTIKERNKNEL